MALDGGMMLEDRRSCQAAADAAALAAAQDLYYNWQANSGADTSGTAQAAALGIASANGFNNDGTSSIVTVNIPPTSGNFAGQTGYAEVIVQYNQPRGFSGIFGGGDLPVLARAVARGTWAPFNHAVVVLHPSAADALFADANSTLHVWHADIIVNSNNSLAAETIGNGVVDDGCAPMYVVGSNPGCCGNFNVNLFTGQNAVPDPLAYLPAPNPANLAVQTTPNTAASITLQPGVYQGGLSFSGQTSVTMQPGMYYMQGGGFSFSGSGTLNAAGVMIYSDMGLTINSLGSVTWSPPTTGNYTGISYFQGRTSSSTAQIVGNGAMNITGTLYVAGGLTDLQGNNDPSIASQVVTLLMKSAGNGTTTISWSAGATALTRKIGLVE
jgi:hypothetical protein